MIEFENAGKRYGRRAGVHALRDVTVRIERGSVCAIVGPNGAGKSTLLGLLLGFLRPTSGVVTVDGLLPQDYVHDHGIGYIPDRFALPPGWPVRDAMRALCGLQGLTASAADAVLDAYGLGDHVGRKVGDLSRGLLQRVGLAQAFAADRELLVLDEPAEGLDPIWRVRLRDAIAAARADGRTVVLASHDLSEVERIADTVLLLDRGNLRETVRSALAAADSFRLQLDGPFDDIVTIFPDVAAIAPDTYVVHAAGTDDLNRRIAALIELGGRVVSLQSGGEGLEERVRRSIDS